MSGDRRERRSHELGCFKVLRTFGQHAQGEYAKGAKGGKREPEVSGFRWVCTKVSSIADKVFPSGRTRAELCNR